MENNFPWIENINANAAEKHGKDIADKLQEHDNKVAGLEKQEQEQGQKYEKLEGELRRFDSEKDPDGFEVLKEEYVKTGREWDNTKQELKAAKAERQEYRDNLANQSVMKDQQDSPTRAEHGTIGESTIAENPNFMNEAQVSDQAEVTQNQIDNKLPGVADAQKKAGKDDRDQFQPQQEQERDDR